MAADMSDVVAHYQAVHEEARLIEGLASLELVRTQEILRRYLPAPPARVLDVGGAGGIHAEWLLHDGYAVHLVDLAPRHVRLALDRLAARGLTAELADARDLPVAADAFDVVLLLGPLYHLHERSDRVRALAEARRVVRPGGLIGVAGINRFASLFDGLVHDYLFDEVFFEIATRDVRDGRHHNPTGRPEWFTTAYLHRPEELSDEIVAARLTLVELVGVEGMAGWLMHLDRRWHDAADRETILHAARLVESEPTLLGLSSHLLAVARRPG